MIFIHVGVLHVSFKRKLHGMTFYSQVVSKDRVPLWLLLCHGKSKGHHPVRGSPPGRGAPREMHSLLFVGTLAVAHEEHVLRPPVSKSSLRSARIARTA